MPMYSAQNIKMFIVPVRWWWGSMVAQGLSMLKDWLIWTADMYRHYCEDGVKMIIVIIGDGHLKNELDDIHGSFELWAGSPYASPFKLFTTLHRREPSRTLFWNFFMINVPCTPHPVGSIRSVQFAFLLKLDTSSKFILEHCSRTIENIRELMRTFANVILRSAFPWPNYYISMMSGPNTFHLAPQRIELSLKERRM